MGTHACRRSALQGDDDLGSLKDRIEIIERLLLPKITAEQREAVEQELREEKSRKAELVQLERDRDQTQDLLMRIYETRSILKRYFEEDALYEKDGHLYIIHNGRTYPADFSFGIFQPLNDAKTAWLKSEKDLMDARFLERRLDDWHALFDPDEIVELNTRIGELSREELDELIEDLEGRLERFNKGYAGKYDASDNEEG